MPEIAAGVGERTGRPAENLPAVAAVHSLVSVRTTLATCAAASFVLWASAGCGDADDGRVSAPVGPTPTPACAYVEARPAYLPWLGAGEEVPEPRRDVQDGTSYVAWSSGGDDPSAQESLTFRRATEPLGGKGEPISVRLEGAQGYYYSAPGPQAAVLWKTGSDACNLVTLVLSLPGSDRATLRDEILKIVESLDKS